MESALHDWVLKATLDDFADMGTGRPLPTVRRDACIEDILACSLKVFAAEKAMRRIQGQLRKAYADIASGVKRCETCGWGMPMTRRNARYCSGKCRQRAYRARR